MKARSYEQSLKEAHVIRQLRKAGYTKVAGKTYKELKFTLATKRGMNQ